MEPANKTVITVANTINAPVTKVWDYWTKPEHIIQWNKAAVDWHCPHSENDLRVGGRFVSRMEARDGSIGFDFEGIYDDIVPHGHIEYTMSDGRKVKITFSANDDITTVVESFEAENTHPLEMQRTGWQNILDNFKKYTESN